jgi:hypothetical protein
MRTQVEKEKLKVVLREHAAKQLRQRSSDKTQKFSKWIKEKTSCHDLNEKTFCI